MTDSSWTRRIVWASGVLLLFGLAVPLLTLNFWRQGIAAALSEGFSRPIRFGAVHVALLDGPGFSIDNVVVEEDPRFGIEPFARMESLQARVALRSLWERRFHFSTLVLRRPSLNVVRAPDGRWNLESLGSSSASSIPSASSTSFTSSTSLPALRIELGRINFKSQEQKQVYVIDELDLDLTPPSSPAQSWALRFEGMPRRTDELLRPVSRIRGQGEFGAVAPGLQKEPGGPLRLDVSAQGALLEDWLRIILGTDYGIHGVLDFQVRLAGTTSLLRLSGNTTLTELHRWDKVSVAGAPALRAEIEGFLDVAAGSLELTSFEAPLPPGSVVVEGRVARLFQDPRPELRAQLDSVPLTTLVEVAKSFTDRLPIGFEGEGTLAGELEMAGGLPSLTGNLRVTDAVFEERETRAALRLSDFSVAVKGETGSLGPVRVKLGEESEIGVSFQWDRGRRTSQAHLEAQALPIRSLLEWVGKFNGAAGGREAAVVVDQGNLAARTDLTLAEGKPPQMRGWVEVSDAALLLATAAEPLRIPSARLVFQRDRVLIRPFSVALGGISLGGTVRMGSFLQAWQAWQAWRGAAEPLTSDWPEIEFDWQLSEIDLAELERLFPAQDRFTSFFRLPLRQEATPSVWDKLVARGTVQAEAVAYRGVAVRNFKASVDFRDRVLEVRRFAGSLAGGVHRGAATVRWGPDPPSFRAETRFEHLDLQQLAASLGFHDNSVSGKLSGTVRLAGSGRNRDEILGRLRGSGRITGQNLTLFGSDSIPSNGPLGESRGRAASLAATFQIARKGEVLTEIQLVPQTPPPGRETADEPYSWSITGTVGFDQKLDLRIQESEGAEYRWIGSFAQSRVTAVRPEPERAFNASAQPK